MKNPFDPGYYNEHDLADAGFREIGRDVNIAKTCTIMGLENISIGSNVRIDGYTLVTAEGSGWLNLGSFIHIGAHCCLGAGAGISMEDFSGVSHGCRLYSKSDDYSGKYLTNPTVPEDFTGVTSGEVRLGRHVVIGSGTVVLPNVTIGEGSSIGALSLVNRSLEPWGVYFGSPVERLMHRCKNLLELEGQLRKQQQ